MAEIPSRVNVALLHCRCFYLVMLHYLLLHQRPSSLFHSLWNNFWWVVQWIPCRSRMNHLWIFSGVFYSIQDNLLFYPDIGQHRACVPSPQIYGLPFEVVYIKTRDKVSLHSYFIRHPEGKGSSVPTLVYFHGNAGNIGGRLQNCNGIYHSLQCNILLVGSTSQIN